jgi:hypothetical protein
MNRTRSLGGRIRRLSGASVTAAYFTTLGIPPAYGRTFTADDDQPGAPTEVVLGARLWRRRFGADPAVVGQTIQLDSQAAHVIGVMPDTFHGAVIDADIWNTLRLDPASAPRGIRFCGPLAVSRRAWRSARRRRRSRPSSSNCNAKIRNYWVGERGSCPFKRTSLDRCDRCSCCSPEPWRSCS